MTNFADELRRAAEDAGDRPAVKLDDLVLNYAFLEAGAARAAGLLRAKGVGEGDRVGLQLPNVPFFPVVYFGALRLGAIVVPMNPLLKAPEVAYHLSDSGAKLLVGWHQFAGEAEPGAREAGAEFVSVEPEGFTQALGAAEPVEEVAERADDDPAVIVYTSGTTGTPKGATLTHANIAAAARAGRDLVDADADTVTVATLPLFHVFGMSSAMNVPLVARGTITLIPRFTPEAALAVIERDRATTFVGVPTMYTAMLHEPTREQRDVSALELCVSGGAPMPTEVLRAFDEAFGAKILEGYGMSETTGMGSFNLPDRERKPGSIGVPIGGMALRLVDDDGEDVPPGEPGEIAMRGPFVMKAYWNRPEATEEVMAGGWLRSGDVARVDEDGYYFIVDRKKDLIIRGGYNVYPREIEEVLHTHPAVQEAAVVGVPHASLGEEVAAAVALTPDADVSPDELKQFLKERVAAYKYPRVVELVEELPKGPTGKILKREVQDDVFGVTPSGRRGST
ncbi:MAG TPA: long-chain fatty acid--CoA ligase [Solirubrobacteraceae bacterium]|nr:long-chain fatty acid--CoA ligase [Solirubrobacteraceae bacterium]